MSGRRPVLVIFGTRPEAIKLAPVIDALAASYRLVPRIGVTGQHREMPRIAARLEAALA